MLTPTPPTDDEGSYLPGLPYIAIDGVRRRHRPFAESQFRFFWIPPCPSRSAAPESGPGLLDG